MNNEIIQQHQNRIELRNIKIIPENRERNCALQPFSFIIEKGEFAAFIGSSGQSISSLQNLFALNTRPESGQLLFDGVNPFDLSAAEQEAFKNSRISTIFQNEEFIESSTILENLMLPLASKGESRKEIAQKLLPLCISLNMEGLLDKYPYQLSEAQKYRAAAVRSLCQRPDLLIVQEPSSVLSKSHCKSLLDLLEEMNKKGQTILIFTQSVQNAARTNRVFYIQNNEIKGDLHRNEMSEYAFSSLTARMCSFLEESAEGPYLFDSPFFREFG